MNPWYPKVSERAGHRCEYCRAPEVIFNLAFEVEHIIPSGQHGEDDDGNLALACRSCNLFKSDHTTAFDETSANEVNLFNPRMNRWEEHFQINPNTGEIEGLTPTARVTIACLQMNSKLQTAARKQWLRLGLLP